MGRLEVADLRRTRWWISIAVVAIVAFAVGAFVVTHRSRGVLARPPDAFPIDAVTCDGGPCTHVGALRWMARLTDPAFVSSRWIRLGTQDGTDQRGRPCGAKVGRELYVFTWRTLYAFDAATGRQRWTADLPQPPSGSASCWLDIDGDAIAITMQPDAEGAWPTVAVVSRTAGAPIATWRGPLRNGGLFRLPIRDGQAVWAAQSGKVIAVALRSGQALWTAQVAPFKGYHVIGRTLFLDENGGDTGQASSIGQLRRIDLRTGAGSTLPLAAPVGPGGRLYRASWRLSDYPDLGGVVLIEAKETVTAVSGVDGSLRWQHKVRPGKLAPVESIDGTTGTVYLNSDRKYAVDNASGAISGPYPHWFSADAPMFDGTGVIEDRAELAGRDAKTGEVRWRVVGPTYTDPGPYFDLTEPRIVVWLGCAPRTGQDRTCPDPVIVAVNA